MIFLKMKLNYIALTLAACLVAVSCGHPADHTETMKISVDTSSFHLRNIVLRNFIDKVHQTPDFPIRLELYESGQLSKDRDVAKALHWGSIEMAAPAQSKLTRFVPEANLFTLPVLYGLPPDVMFALMEGEVGHAVNRMVEERIGVKILGKNIILGFTNIYTTDHKIEKTEDLAGLKIRIPGGSGPIALFQQLNINPLALPISDVPLALAQGNLNGIQSTHETVASTKLWDVGIRYCFEDRANLIFYVPMVSLEYWDSLSLRSKNTLQSAWADVVKDARRFSSTRQLRAKALLTDAGIECIQADRSNLSAARIKMDAVSKKLVETLHIDPELYTQLVEEVEQLMAIQQVDAL